MKKTHNKKKIIILIVYILLIGLCTLVAIKGCTTNITYALDATNWEQLNNIPVRCVIDGLIDNTDLSNNTWSYISNGNSETGPAQATPAFYITDTFDGEQYDAIYIKTRDIQLRRFIYDEISGDVVDYYSRTIWQDDWIVEQITPHAIIFENLNNTTMASNAVKYSLAGFGGQEQTGANHNAINGIMLGIINDIFDYYADYQNIILNSTQYYGGRSYEAQVYTIEYNNKLYGYLFNHSNINKYIYLTTPITPEYIINEYTTDVNLRFYTNSISFIYYDSDNTQIIANIEVDQGISFRLSNNYNYDWYYSIDIVKNYLEDLNYTEGYIEGTSEGYSDGYREGTSEGYREGYEDGASGEINTTWVLSLMNTATSILNIEILPNIRLIYLVGAFIVLAFVRFVIGWLR